MEEARIYVERNFPDHPGSTIDFIYPICTAEAQLWCDDFLEKRLEHFSAYHHAIAADDPFLYRAVLSSSLNIGLLSPGGVLKRLDTYLHNHPLPLEAVEAFVSRLVGMREYTRAVYLKLGKRQRAINYFIHSHRLSPMWHGGHTGLPPLDDVLHKLARYAYCSQSERLMVLGNLMLLSETHPDEAYRFFMTMFIDAYDWAVVPNVYGASQHAEGGLMSATPHFNCADELVRLSDYRAGPWCTTWDGLYWRFVDRHRILFGRSQELKSMVSRCKKIPGAQLKRFEKAAKGFLDKATR